LEQLLAGGYVLYIALAAGVLVVAGMILLVMAITRSASADDAQRFEFSDFSGGFFEDPDYRTIHATCAPGTLLVEFDPDGRTEVSYRNGNPAVSLSVKEAEIGCGEAVVNGRRGGWYQRGITGALGSTKLECRTERPISIFVSPLFGRGERRVVGGWMIVSTPARNVAPRILIGATYDEEDDRSILHYRRARCRLTGH
jgi:hypothetical protein